MQLAEGLYKLQCVMLCPLEKLLLWGTFRLALGCSDQERMCNHSPLLNLPASWIDISIMSNIYCFGQTAVSGCRRRKTDDL